MRARSAVLAVAALIIGVVMGSMLNPRPTGAVSKEIIQLQEDVSQLLPVVHEIAQRIADA